MAVRSKPLTSRERASSIQKAAKRKRSRETEAEQTTDVRRAKRPRRPILQPEGKKRQIDNLDPIQLGSAQAPRKQRRRYRDQSVVDNSVDQGEEASKVDEDEHNPVFYWTRHFKWPQRYTEHSNNNMSHLLAKQKSSASLRRRQSGQVSIDPATTGPTSVAPSSTTPSDQRPREVKSAPYQDPRYKLLLATKCSFMEESDLDITQQSKKIYLNLLDAKQTVPSESLFRDDLFKWTCQNIQDRNETRVIRDISLLIVPSAETLTTYGARNLKILIESTNEGWNNSLPLTGTRPQPDFSVGFKREAFTKEQLDKLTPFIGNFISGDQSYFMATYYMYFPFLTCEVKCGAAALDIADRQNAHSMTLAVRATVELFRLVGREMELHREILAFSISHDYSSVRIYGHYPVIDGKETKYYRHPIRKFDFTELEGREKWTAYKFTKNVYDIWMPSHFKRLCSAIDEIPADLDFSVPQLSQNFGLEQELERHNLSASSQPDSQSQGHSTGDATHTTHNTSLTGRERPKKRARKRLAEEE